ncbi:hypothetical protein JCM8547_007178 [Rhodosporidiobolus lusitaniae]
MDREQFRKAAYAAADRICDYFEKLEKRDVVPNVQPGDIAGLLPQAPPENGEEWSEIAGDFDRVVLPGITHWQHPSFFAYFPANTNYESILADMYAGAVSNPGFNWSCSPTCTELESVVMDWVAKLLGLDSRFHNASGVGAGVLNTTASEGCLVVCIAARERYLRLYPDTRASDFVIIATDQTHSLAAKAAKLLGLSFHAIQTKKENDWSLRGDQLREELEMLKGQGKKPFILIATLGSTSTGAIDNIPEITAVTADYPELFLHVDAAWGGVQLALPECRPESFADAINASAVEGKRGEVHSLIVNLHKSGLVMFDASCLWTGDRSLLTEALDVTPHYLKTEQAEQGQVVDLRNMGLALGRRFRSLKVWFVLRSYGVSGFQKHLTRLNDLTVVLERLVTGEIDGVEKLDVELFTPRRFHLLVLHVRALPSAEVDKLDAAALLAYENALNAAVYKISTGDHSLMITATSVGGQECVRIAVGSSQTEERHLRELVEKLRGMIKRAREETPLP